MNVSCIRPKCECFQICWLRIRMRQPNFSFCLSHIKILILGHNAMNNFSFMPTKQKSNIFVWPDCLLAIATHAQQQYFDGMPVCLHDPFLCLRHFLLARTYARETSARQHSKIWNIEHRCNGLPSFCMIYSAFNDCWGLACGRFCWRAYIYDGYDAG